MKLDLISFWESQNRLHCWWSYDNLPPPSQPPRNSIFQTIQIVELNKVYFILNSASLCGLVTFLNTNVKVYLQHYNLLKAASEQDFNTRIQRTNVPAKLNYLRFKRYICLSCKPLQMNLLSGNVCHKFFLIILPNLSSLMQWQGNEHDFQQMICKQKKGRRVKSCQTDERQCLFAIKKQDSNTFKQEVDFGRSSLMN